MAGVYDEHAVKLEAHGRSRLHIPDTGQQQGRQHLAVRGTGVNPLRDHLKQAVARRLFDEPDKRFDFGPEWDEARFEFGVLGGDSRQRIQETELRGGPGGAAEGGGLQKLTTIGGVRHGATPQDPSGDRLPDIIPESRRLPRQRFHHAESIFQQVARGRGRAAG